MKMFFRVFGLVLAIGTLLVLGCTERRSTPSSSESATSTDTAKATGADKRDRTWQEARRRGVQFRAIGQEPGWLIEVTAESLQVEWNYGQQVASGKRIEMGGSPSSGDVHYRAKTDQGPVQVEAVERRCVDPMNGDAFPLTVTVRLATDTLSGCGRLLRE